MRNKQNMIICIGVALILLIMSVGNAAANDVLLDVAFDIELTQDADTNPVGTEHTVTATVTQIGFAGALPAPDGTIVNFIISGPNAAKSGSNVTTGGVATFTYTGDVVTTDIITALAYSPGFVPGVVPCTCNTVTKTWIPGGEIPEFPTIALPVVAILGLAFFFQRRKE
ncbi:PEF-CTERM sorting domain-containing protein [Methanolobus sp. ZRKC3]|uniref:PEF-CTERM sorting domain-containing protein n=1 Tax=Methanolobus sp. ZRKC3 TaxID=3125786 RepID=UPI00325510A7